MPEDRKELTEYSKKREYEEKLTDELIRAFHVLESVSNDPTYENLRVAYNTVETFTNLNVYSSHYLKKLSEKIKPELTNLQIVLFGDLDSKETLKRFALYEIFIENYEGKIRVYNPQNILKEMREILFLVKQYGYAQGLYLQKPYDRKFGNEAISDVLKM
jgi:hypothetical protein